MTHPKIAKDFKVWAALMLEQAHVQPELKHKPHRVSGAKQSSHGQWRRKRRRARGKRRKHATSKD